MYCSDHGERLYAPVNGDARCLGHSFDRVRPLLGLSEAADDAFREWLFDGADRDTEEDALDRYSRATQLDQNAATMLAAFWRDRPSMFRHELEAYRAAPSARARPHILMPAEALDFVLAEIELIAEEAEGGEQRFKLILELLGALRPAVRLPGVAALSRAQDLLLLLRSSEMLENGRARTGFQIAANRTRDLIATLGGL